MILALPTDLAERMLDRCWKQMPFLKDLRQGLNKSRFIGSKIMSSTVTTLLQILKIPMCLVLGMLAVAAYGLVFG